MLKLALALFAVAALAGVTMALLHFRGRTPPKPLLVVLHGLFAASGLVVLLLAVVKIGFGGAPGIAVAGFLLAAMGGFLLLSFHLRDKPLPNALVAGHGVIAVASFVVLLSAVTVVGL